MPRRNIQPRQPITSAKPPAPVATAEKKWPDTYRPSVINTDAGFEFGENKFANRLVFTFFEKPSEEIRAKLRHYGYLFDDKQIAWSVNATAQTRVIAERLIEEFASRSQEPSSPAL